MLRSIFLWSHPRARSTALERAFLERDDAIIVHEPFSLVKYRGIPDDSVQNDLARLKDGLSPSYLEKICHYPTSASLIFIKDFPYHTPTIRDPGFIRSHSHFFLVRDPEEAISSWQSVHPEFCEWELGYLDLLQMIERVLQVFEERLLILDSSELVSNTTASLHKICEELEITFSPNMEHWRPRERIAAWQEWEKYHRTALSTEGFVNTRASPRELTLRNRRFVDRAKPIYERILSFRR
jgi:hypothetical protein